MTVRRLHRRLLITCTSISSCDQSWFHPLWNKLYWYAKEKPESLLPPFVASFPTCLKTIVQDHCEKRTWNVFGREWHYMVVNVNSYLSEVPPLGLGAGTGSVRGLTNLGFCALVPMTCVRLYWLRFSAHVRVTTSGFTDLGLVPKFLWQCVGFTD